MKLITLQLSAAAILGLSVSTFAQDAAPAPAAPTEAAAPDKKSALSEEEQKAAAIAEFNKAIESIGWTREGKVKVGKNAELQLTSGLQFTDSKGAQKLLRMFGNLPSGHELGILAAPGEGELEWWAEFGFSEEGYVKDDEKDSIDADKLLETKREAQKEDNKARVAQGLKPYKITGWAVKPFYNEQSKSLEHGIKIADEDAGPGEESVNYSTMVLGRRGVMHVTLVCDPTKLEPSLAALRTTLKGFNYVSGETYAEYQKGDKVSEYGLTALIAGGSLAVAAKTGLLAKLWKPIAIGFIALLAGVKKIWGKITGKGDA